MARIVVMDDDEQVRELLQDILQANNHEVMVAEDGAQGMIKCREFQPDLVITDIVMPEQEGIETISKLRQEYPDLKVIAVSGGGQVAPETYLKIAECMGANRTLPKPFKRKDILDAIDELLA